MPCEPQSNAPAFAATSVQCAELQRASAVAEVYSLAAREPALNRSTVINLVLVNHRGEIAERSLHRWLAQFQRGGLAELADTRKGRSGRKRKAVES